MWRLYMFALFYCRQHHDACVTPAGVMRSRGVIPGVAQFDATTGTAVCTSGLV